MPKNTFAAFSIFCFFTAIGNHVNAQQIDTIARQFILNIEVRPRAEYTSNYILPPNDSIDPYFYITQRNRISMQYSQEKWLLKADVQEIHLWDNENSNSKVGSINFINCF